MYSIFAPVLILAIVHNATAQFITGPGDLQAKICMLKNPNLADAIGRFCSKTDIVTPSDYTRLGGEASPPYSWVNIMSTCSPPQWIPSQICRNQFNQMCVTGDQFGQKDQNFGRNGCQRWHAQSHDTNKPKPPKRPKKSLGSKVKKRPHHKGIKIKKPMV